jgi:hypothetical protein
MRFRVTERCDKTCHPPKGSLTVPWTTNPQGYNSFILSYLRVDSALGQLAYEYRRALQKLLQNTVGVPTVL